MSATLTTSPKIARGRKVNRKRSSADVSKIFPDVPSEDQADSDTTTTLRPGTPEDPPVLETPTIKIKRVERSVVIRVRQNRLLGGAFGSLEEDTKLDTEESKEPTSDEEKDDDDDIRSDSEEEEGSGKRKVSRKNDLI